MDRALVLLAEMADVTGIGRSIPALVNGLSKADAVNFLWVTRTECTIVFACMVLLLWLHHHLKESSLGAFYAKLPYVVRVLIPACMLYLTAISFSGEDSAFIYFQF